MYEVSMSHKRISPEQVSKDNSDIWRYSPELNVILRKENYVKSKPAMHIDYLDACGELELTSPYPDLDLKMDLEKFKENLDGVDLEIFNLMLLGMKHREISEIVGLTQPTISKRLKRIRDEFKEFYYEGD